MKITKVFKNTKSLLQQTVDSLKKNNKEEVKELKKIEQQLQVLKKKEQVTEDHLIWDGKTMMRFWLMGLFVVFIGFIGYHSLNFIYLILSALIISFAMEAIISFFSKKIARWLSIIIAYFLLIVFLLSGIIFIIPFLASQTTTFVEITMNNIANIQSMIETHGLIGYVESIRRLPEYFKHGIIQSFNNPTLLQDVQIKIQENISAIVGTGTSYAKDIANIAGNFLAGFADILWKLILVLTLSVLFSIEKNSVIEFISNLGGKRREFIKIKLKKLYKKLGLWLKGQLLLCLFIAIAMLISLIIMSAFGIDIPQKGSLAVIAGLTELIPYLGPILGGIPAVIVVLLHNGFVAGLIMVGVIFVIQWLENNILIPIVMNKTLGVNPVTIFISMILGGLIMGFVGVLLAVPIAVILTMFLGGKFEHNE